MMIRVAHFILKSIKSYYVFLTGIFITTALIVVEGCLKPIIMKSLINSVAGQYHADLWFLCVAFGMLQILVMISFVCHDFCLTRFLPQIRASITSYFLEAAYKKDTLFFQSQLSGNISSKLSDIIQVFPDVISIFFSQIFINIIMILLSLIIISFLSPVFLLAASLWLFGFFLVIFFSMKQSINCTIRASESKGFLLGRIMDIMSNMMATKIFKNIHYEFGRIQEDQNAYVKDNLTLGYHFLKVYGVLGLLTASFYSLFLVILLHRYYGGLVTPGDFAFVIMTGANIVNNTYQLSYAIRTLSINLGTVENAFRALGLGNEHPSTIPSNHVALKTGRIFFKNVSFSFDKPVLKNLSFEIQNGETVGIVGYSGSGKTTLSKLLLGFFEIDSGEILIGNISLANDRKEQIREYITVVTQDHFLFHRSIFDNIHYGNLSASHQSVYAAAKKACAHDFISSLPNGYETLTGEKGVKLSGGEKQRVSIARAFLRHTPIFIFDEVTSHLDEDTAFKVMDNLLDFTKDKTTLLITHKIEFLPKLDRILLLHNGEIQATGNHATLMRENIVYRNMLCEKDKDVAKRG